jgi:hypothetical protein
MYGKRLESMVGWVLMLYFDQPQGYGMKNNGSQETVAIQL